MGTLLMKNSTEPQEFEVFSGSEQFALNKVSRKQMVLFRKLRAGLVLLFVSLPVATLFLLNGFYEFSVVVAGLSVYALSYVFVLSGRLYAEYEDLTVQALRDPLTGAFNRRFLQQQLEQVQALKRQANEAVSLLVLDIDFFKRINDDFGHDVGDLILISLVERITSRVRDSDALCRIGGEEFVLVLSATNGLQARVLAEDIRIMIANQSFELGVRLSLSIGVAELRAEEDIAGWMKRGDRALYQAKQQGRNRVVMGLEGLK
jgi:diguanylate cyclase (GGDEF)-like protein